MAKKELTKEQAAKFLAAYAKKHGVSEQKAKEMIFHSGISRLATLKKAADKKKAEGGGKVTKRAAKKAAKPATKKKAATRKAAPRKPKTPAAKPAAVSEGEE